VSTDVTEQISAVERRLGARTLAAGEARVSTIARTYPGDPADVWDAVTDPERIARWFLPVSGDLRPGGRYQLEGNAGGTVERCDPPRSFAATWEFGGEVSWIEVRLTSAGDGTRLELEHVAHVADEWWDQFGPGATGVGWDGALHGLALHLTAPEVVMTPAEREAWGTTDEGRAFLAASSAAWVEASIAAGTDPAAARAAGARTTAFYTGEPPA
jgi:uncharacterized protein YndB with AHSA1/START domain